HLSSEGGTGGEDVEQEDVPGGRQGEGGDGERLDGEEREEGSRLPAVPRSRGVDPQGVAVEQGEARGEGDQEQLPMEAVVLGPEDEEEGAGEERRGGEQGGDDQGQEGEALEVAPPVLAVVGDAGEAGEEDHPGQAGEQADDQAQAAERADL